MVTVPVKAGYFRDVSPAPHPRDLRASDADRERVVTALGEAAADGRLTPDEHSERVASAYHARTLGQLAALTRDLAVASEQPLRLDASRAVVAFFGTQRREGRWVVPGVLTATAVGGHVVLDMREAILQDQHTIVQATVIGGQLHLLVPGGVTVTVVPGRLPWRPASSQGQVASATAAPALPRIEVRSVTLAGRIRVHTPRPPGGRWRWLTGGDRRP